MHLEYFCSDDRSEMKRAALVTFPSICPSVHPSVAVVQHHDQGNLGKKGFIGLMVPGEEEWLEEWQQVASVVAEAGRRESTPLITSTV